MDPIQFFGSLVAILVIALIAALLFRNRVTLLNEERIKRAIERTLPDCTLHGDFADTKYTIFLDAKSMASLVQLQNTAKQQFQSHMAVIAVGDRTVARVLAASSLPSPSEVTNESGHILIKFADFTAPSRKLYYDASNRDALIALLQRAEKEQRPQG